MALRYLNRISLPYVVPSSFGRMVTRNKKTLSKYSQTGIGVVGAPFDRGQQNPGTEDGPTTCRASGFVDVLTKSLNLDIKDYGDIDFGLKKRTHKPAPYVPMGGTTGMTIQPKFLDEVSRANKMISDSVGRILRDNRISLCLGGDHSIAIGSVHGVSEVYNDLALLWVDAHADINTTPTSLTGNMHGMPASFLIPELIAYQDKLPQFDWLTPRIRAANIAYIGLRDVDFSERAIIDMLGIRSYSMKEVDEYGIRNCVRMALDSISPRGCRPVHLSFDIDALDDREVKSTGTAVPGGLTLREAHVLLEEVHNSGLMVAMDLVEVNPGIGNPNDVTRVIQVVRQMLTTVFGYHRGGVRGNQRIIPVAKK